MKGNWFKIALTILLAIFIYQISMFLGNIAWTYAYAERGQCLERIYARGNNDSFDSKANCFDIIYPFNN